MNGNIEYILQIEGQNLLQVHYASGANRFVRLSSRGDYSSNMTKSQLDYMHNAKMYEMRNAGGWGKSHYYYLKNNSPILSFIKK